MQVYLKKKLENLLQNSTSDDCKILELKNELIVLQKNNELFEVLRRLKDQIHKNFDEQKKKDGNVMLEMDLKKILLLENAIKKLQETFMTLLKTVKLNNEAGLPC